MPLREPRSTAPLREGDILAGKYRIERIIGAGAMGVVVSARHLKLDERVAIKFLLPEALSNREAVARFEREGRAAVKIKNEHVVRVIDVGNLDNGAPYMVMEHLEGDDLSVWLRERGPLSCEAAVELVLQALEAVAEAHAMGIVHRDLKPSNLFCVRRSDRDPCVKVLDFGISKVGSGSASVDLGMTRTSDVMGSPLYMSPEQMESARDVDAATDIWAIGITLFQLITGRTPFVAATIPELVLRIANGAPERLRAARPAAPPGLERVILRCLEKSRTKRYRDVAELARALAEFGPPAAHASADRIARTMQGAASPASAMPAAVAPPAPRNSVLAPRPIAEQTLDAWGQTAPKRRVRRRTLVGLALAMTAAPMAVAARWLAGSDTSPTTVLSGPPEPPISAALDSTPAPATTAVTSPAPIMDPPAMGNASIGGADVPRALVVRAPDFAMTTASSAPTRNARPPGLGISSPRPAGSARRPAREPRPAASAATPVASTREPVANEPPNTVYDERK